MTTVNNAKQKSIDLLEVTVASLCLSLNVDQAELASGFEIPVDENHLDYKSYTSLMSMYSNLQRLLGE